MVAGVGVPLLGDGIALAMWVRIARFGPSALALSGLSSGLGPLDGKCTSFGETQKSCGRLQV